MKRSQIVFESLHLGTELLKENKEVESLYMNDGQSIQRAAGIMRKLQGDEVSMFKGMDLLYVDLLGGDTYNVSDDYKKKYIADRVRQYKEQGLFD